MSAPSVFGEIRGFPVGAEFKDREAVRTAKLHRHGQGGISGNYAQGADAIIVSGGYIDDEDHGDRIVYTGQGGRNAGSKKQAFDQTLTRGNLALVYSEQRGLPVRVIRGDGGDERFSPRSGYRYDGLFLVTQHWSQASIDGPLIWRYVLERAEGGSSWGIEAPANLPPAGESNPSRASSVVQRIVRNSAVTQWVKDIYRGACQICGIQLETRGGPYSEGAHIRALGSPHNGPDEVTNVLCLCPNDHVLFDKGALYLDGGHVYRTVGRELIGKLTVHARHVVDWAHADYHRRHFAGVD